MSKKTINREVINGVCKITLSNPRIYNAFDNQLIQDFIKILKSIEIDNKIMAILIQAQGPHFSAGADLQWMQAMAQKSPAENQQDAMQLATLLQQLASCPKPTLALIQGKTLGGGAGLVACCDIVIAQASAQLRFSEVKLGLIPATIAPYVIRKIGYSQALRYFISAEWIDATTAQQLNLVHEIAEDLTAAAEQFITQLLKNGPEAIAAIKSLTQQLTPISTATIEQTAQCLAAIRTSAEAQEGITAFLQKRNPNWIK